MKRLCFVVLLVSLMASGASANVIWGGTSNNWSDPTKWTGGILPGPADTAEIDNGVVTLDSSQSIAILLMNVAAATDNATLSITSDVTLTISKSSTELLGLSKAGNGTATINQSAGLVKVFQPSGTAGEVRLADGNPIAVSYNLSDTGILDTQVLSRGAKDRTNANFNATGGTLIVRTMIYKWGLVSENASYGFHQGGCLLKPGGSIGSITIGNSSNLTDYIMDSTSKIEFELGNGDPNPLSSVNDLITSWGNFTIDGELQVSFTDLGNPPEVGDKWNVWTIAAGKEGSFSGSGSFDIIPANIQVNWIDTGNGTDTLQLQYIPEPATMVLLGLGSLIAIRRRRSK